MTADHKVFCEEANLVSNIFNVIAEKAVRRVTEMGRNSGMHLLLEKTTQSGRQKVTV